MKYLKFIFLGILIFQQVRADGVSEIRAKPYLVNCDKAMALFSKDGSVEKKLVELADTPEKMLQLVHDYKLLFSKDFAHALLVKFQLDHVGVGTLRQQMKSLYRMSKKSKRDISPYIWKALEMARDLSTRDKTDALAQIRFTQLKNIIEALKISPNRHLFEDLAYIAVQASLIDFASNLPRNDNWLTEEKAREERLTVNAGFSVFWGLLALGIAGDVFTYEHPLTIVGLIAGAIFGGVTAKITNLIVEDHTPPKKPEIGQPLNLKVFDAGHEVIHTSNSIFEFLNIELQNGILSVQEGCAQNICKLSPVQVAYLGHVNVLELEGLNNTLKSAMAGGSFGEEQTKVGEAARAVHEDPSHYGKQMVLARTLEEFLNKISSLSDSREKAAKALVDYASSLSQNTVSALREKPYKDRPTSDEDIAKNQLLLTKIQYDLASLEEIKVNSQAIETKLQNSAKVIGKLRALLAHLPTGPEGWSEAADEVILGLDELK